MKDATVSVRVEENIKSQAESILQQLGIPVSVAINALYRQIIDKNGLPFSLTLSPMPQTKDTLSHAALHAKLQHSYEQSLAGKGKPMEEVFDALGANK